MIWHIYWLAAIGLVGIITSVIIRTSDDHSEYVVTAAKIEKIEAAALERYS
jgi:cytochrome o ubiquinol oxidase subunit 1